MYALGPGRPMSGVKITVLPGREKPIPGADYDQGFVAEMDCRRRGATAPTFRLIAIDDPYSAISRGILLSYACQRGARWGMVSLSTSAHAQCICIVTSFCASAYRPVPAEG